MKRAGSNREDRFPKACFLPPEKTRQYKTGLYWLLQAQVCSKRQGHTGVNSVILCVSSRRWKEYSPVRHGDDSGQWCSEVLLIFQS